jgi:hypothetical protein
MAIPGKRLLDQRLHNLLCGGVTRTPPIETRAPDICVCSQVSARDITMYLVAIKSFHARLGLRKIFAINDGSLTNAHVGLLKEQVPGITILHAKDAPRRQVPKGGCWERFLHIVQLAQSDYVIQLDSDTISRGTMEEVRDSCAQQRPFIMAGDRDGARIISCETASRNAAPSTKRHVQILLEQKLSQIDGLMPNYVRGCAAFFGLPAGIVSLDAVEEFSRRVQSVLGDRWMDWGSEQATVNYFLANLTGTIVLQPPKYTHRWKETPAAESAFVHFIGTHRFDGQFYGLQSRRIIRELQQPMLSSGTLDAAAG